ncbi:LppU/SCO3897 family protein [Streptomyces cinerochromogenes]|uniref:LppU/SCO3897 family protein n=1 Tax=Streptomyces cinerochromogenes TaxID=66422 RepID=UPI0019C53DC2|nr:hypothetical protein [Streptomyces cinerochromogenes]GGS51437.1 hypothetical protein GCM10010206_11460 [Streptomyces cinerochromogenes]
MSTPHPPHAYPYRQPPGPGCEVCGAMPAAPVTVRGHQGMVVVMRFLRRRGVLCRTCGLAVARTMQADTLVRGWWGALSMFITPVTLLLNLGALSRIRRLPPPATAAWRPPLDPGRPVLRRPAGLFALIPLAGLAMLLVGVPVLVVIGTSSEPAGVHYHHRQNREPLAVGACAHNDGDWTNQDLRNVPCDSPDAQFEITEPKDGYCADGDYMARLEYSVNGRTSLCLHPVGN